MAAACHMAPTHSQEAERGKQMLMISSDTLTFSLSLSLGNAVSVVLALLAWHWTKSSLTSPCVRNYTLYC